MSFLFLFWGEQKNKKKKSKPLVDMNHLSEIEKALEDNDDQICRPVPVNRAVAVNSAYVVNIITIPSNIDAF